MRRDPIGCTDGCGATVADMNEGFAKAWTLLPITSRWRCPSCARALAQINEHKAEEGSTDDAGR